MYSSWDEFPYRAAHGAPDPHVFGPHLDFPFGQLTADINHLPGMGAGVNEKLPFPQFLQMRTDSVQAAEAELAADAASEAADAQAAASALADEGDDEEEQDETTEIEAEEVEHEQHRHVPMGPQKEAVEGRDFTFDGRTGVVPSKQGCVNCAFRD